MHVTQTSLLVLQTRNIQLEQCQEEHEQEVAPMLHLLFDSMRRQVGFMLSRDMLVTVCKALAQINSVHSRWQHAAACIMCADVCMCFV